MWYQTRVSELLSIQLPIIQAPMAGGATTPELVAAVSNAGALGSFGAGYMAAEDLRQAIRKTRTLTQKPFSVNLFIPEEVTTTSEEMTRAILGIQKSCSELNIDILPVEKPYLPSFDEQMNVVLEENISILSFTFGTLSQKWVSLCKKNKILLIGLATSLPEARVLEKEGIDLIVAQGLEAGGHRGTFLGAVENSLIPLSDLIEQLVTDINCPIIAAGGIMRGKDISKCLTEGAEGVQMGTAFLTCPESGAHSHYKTALLQSRQDETVLTRVFSGKMARGLNNKFIKNMTEQNSYVLPYPIQNALTSAMRKEAQKQSKIDFMSLWAGQAASLSRGIPAAKLIEQLVAEVKS